MVESVVVTLFTKPDCPLCREAEILLEAVSFRWPLRIVRINILEDSEVYERYRDRIPVLRFATGETLEPPIQRDKLTALIRSLIPPQHSRN